MVTSIACTKPHFVVTCSVSWYRALGITELIFIALFAVLYSAYLIRIIRIANSLRTPFMPVFIKLLFRTLAFTLLIIALLGPSFGAAKREVQSVGKDIMICVDLSNSMDAFDVTPTRLEKVKYEMKKIVQAFNSDRIGIIIFSSEAFIQCPLTYDQNALNLFIETMNTSLVPSSGTDFAPPLRMAMDKLEQDNVRITQTTSKVIILISDGEDFGDETSAIAQQIESKGYKLFALGIGTESGGRIRSGTGFRTDRQGNVVITKLNAKALQSLASKTGGRYFEINESRNDVARLINTINSIEGELMDARLIDVSANKYFYFLLLAVILLALDVLVHIRTIRI
ncbi:MAG: VWA domain-containing protein [Cyclobacteriaceae bacterium]|nr:VWA domain-containing protein [Cyclobacteriaceae bacterium]UYN85639.1 MAG: VWA domain-containing protein [Cyclobacteriaceae bacterium]